MMPGVDRFLSSAGRGGAPPRRRALIAMAGLLALGPACRDAAAPDCGGRPCLYELGTMPLVGFDGREVLPAGYAGDQRAVYQIWGGSIRFERDFTVVVQLDFREFVRETGASNRKPESSRYTYRQQGLGFTTVRGSGAYVPASGRLVLSAGVPHAQLPPHQLIFGVPAAAPAARR